MNKAPHAALSHPLVAAYLADLDRALATADPQERLDTVTSVTEHLTEALGDTPEPTNEQVRAVLDDLGSPEQIAATATPASAIATPETEQPATRGDWAPAVLLGAAIVSLVLPFIGAVLAIGCLVAAIVLLRRETQRRGMLQAAIAVSIVTLVITAVLAAGTLSFSAFNVDAESSSGPAVSVEAPAATTGP